MTGAVPHSAAKAGWLLIPQDTGLRAVLTKERGRKKEKRKKGTTGGFLVKKKKNVPGVSKNITPLCGAAESQPCSTTDKRQITLNYSAVA